MDTDPSSSPLLAPRTCICPCKKSFVPRRADHIYASRRCKVAAHRARQLRAPVQLCEILLDRVQQLRQQAGLSPLSEDPLLRLLALRQAADGAARLQVAMLVAGVELQPLPDPVHLPEVLHYYGEVPLYLHTDLPPQALSQMEPHPKLADPHYERVGVGVVHPAGAFAAALVVVLGPALPTPGDLDSAPKLSA